MIVILRNILVMVCVGLLMASCGAKAKKTREVQEAIQRMNEEHEAQKHKQGTESTVPEEQVTGQRTDGIAARVNEEVILLSDLDEAASDLTQGIRDEDSDAEAGQNLRDARRTVLERLIEKKLLEQAAKKRNIEISDDEVDESIDDLVRKRGLTKDEFLVQLARERVSTEEFRERIRRELMVYKLLDIDIRRHLHVSDEQCREYYEAHREEFVAQEGGFRIRQIVLFRSGAMSPEEKEEKRALIEQLRERILAGEDFGTLAREFSEGPNAEKGGNLGFFEEGELLDELDRAASSLEVGELSPVIETAMGYHLIEVTERATGESRSLEAVKEEIKARLRRQAYGEELNKLLKSLKETAHIDVRL